ncbi:MAG: phage tail protein [Veillonella parvula]|uniref:gp53-like domain-containing protein n=1 Tax=Veillonella parvula TaxID=29466 RepID=UPI003617AE4D
MAKYPAVITTMAGTNATAEANASKQALIFTKIVIGAGDPPASIARATGLTDKRLELAITKSTKSGDGQFTVQASLSNANLGAGFYAREIGLMAKVGESGREVLFSYTNGGSYVDYIPDKTTPMDSYTITITTVIGNAEKVQAIVQDNGYATIHDLEEHNKSANAHRAEFDKKLDVNSRQYVKTIAKHNQGLQVTKGDNSQEIINFITGNYNDTDTNKVLNLGTLKGLLGQGAIVVSKLDANAGFVKFANGFTIQWGIGGADNQQKSTVTYPIRFSTVFIVGAMDAFWEGSDTPKYISNSSRESNNTKAVFIGNDQYVGSYYWFALGMA